MAESLRDDRERYAICQQMGTVAVSKKMERCALWFADLQAPEECRNGRRYRVGPEWCSMRIRED
jgi:hypothetical protein